MRRFIATVVVMGCGMYVLGLFNARPTRHNVAVASNPSDDDEFDSSAADASASGTSRRSLMSQEDSLAEADPFDNDSPIKPIRANRFDRGRLNEQFDGEYFQKGPARASAEQPITLTSGDEIVDSVAVELNSSIEIAQAFPAPDYQDVSPSSQPLSKTNTLLSDALGIEATAVAQVPAPRAQKDQDFLRDVPPALRSKLIPVPQRRPAKHVASGVEDTPVFETVPNRAAPVAAAPSLPRVTLVVEPDHSLKIFPEGKFVAENGGKIPEGQFVITAEHFEITPTNHAGQGNRVTCTGKVQLQTAQFSATCATFSLQGNEILLAGDVKSRAELVKTKKVGEEISEDFRLSADKIMSSLTLDTIRIGNGETLLPNRPNATLAPQVGAEPVAEPKVVETVEPGLQFLEEERTDKVIPKTSTPPTPNEFDPPKVPVPPMPVDVEAPDNPTPTDESTGAPLEPEAPPALPEIPSP